MSERIRAGTEVFFAIEVRDNSIVPPPLINPQDGVTITIIDPNETVVVPDAVMAQESTGVYTYAYQTAVGQTPGSYLAKFRAQHGPAVALTPDLQVFELVAA